ncbi:MAG: hypothetical protein ACFFCI_05520 [Promethearchaeota archaeon]
MSSGNLINNKSDSSEKVKPESQFKVSSVIIPFSKLFKSFKPADIYSGDENIPFKERDPEYRMILRQEFGNMLKKEK